MHRPTTLKEESRKPDKVRVLMFSGYSEENEGNLMRTASRVVEECKKKGIECFVGFVPYARSYKNEDGTRTVVNKDGKEFIANRHDTVVLVRGAASGSSGTLDMISAFERDGFFVINSRESIEICSDKYRTAITLTEAGLPTPRTALVTEIDQIEEVHKQVGGKFPVVAKTIRGSKGIGVFIIDSPEGLKSTMQAFSSVDDSQEIIFLHYKL
jgi:glutathione synthase/RimK-type ligase-like ATP-grasp enzyme